MNTISTKTFGKAPLALALAMLLGPTFRDAAADPTYTFSKITAVSGSNAASIEPVVNDSGVVAYRGDTGVYRASSSTAPELIDARIGFNRSLSINNSGWVAYSNFTGPFGSQLLVNDGSVSRPVLGGNDYGIVSSSLNDSNIVVTGQQSNIPEVAGIYAGLNGQAASRIYASAGNIRNFGSAPVINDSSAVAFLAYGGFGPGTQAAILLGDVNGGSPSIVAIDTEFNVNATETTAFYGKFDMNDHGDVAFATYTRAYTEPNPPTRYELHVAHDGSISTILSLTSTSGSAFSDDGVALNNSGSLAFILSTGGTYGIFTGGDLLHDKVIAIGDRLDGGRVTGLQFGRGGLNNAGQIAFLANVYGDDGQSRLGIYLATPTAVVPEPSSIVLMGIAGVIVAAGAARRHWRRPVPEK
jgi:hypothetical protein